MSPSSSQKKSARYTGPYAVSVIRTRPTAPSQPGRVRAPVRGLALAETGCDWIARDVSTPVSLISANPASRRVRFASHAPDRDWAYCRAAFLLQRPSVVAASARFVSPARPKGSVSQTDEAVDNSVLDGAAFLCKLLCKSLTPPSANCRRDRCGVRHREKVSPRKRNVRRKSLAVNPVGDSFPTPPRRKRSGPRWRPLSRCVAKLPQAALCSAPKPVPPQFRL